MLFALLSVLAFALQNICCKEYGRRFSDSLYAQAAMTLGSVSIVALIMMLMGGMQPLSPRGYLITASFGAFFVMTLSAMTLAMRYGHMGIALLIQNSSLIVPVLVGLFFWKEALTLPKGIGILCVLLMLLLSAGEGAAPATPEAKKHWNRRRWALFTALAFMGDSSLNILQKLMALESESTSTVVFTFWTSLFSAALALMILLLCRLRGLGGALAEAGRRRRSFALCIAGIGLGTAGGNAYTILALTALPSVIMFPLQQGGLVLLMWLLGVLVYREKTTVRALMMLVFGLTGIVLLGL